MTLTKTKKNTHQQVEDELKDMTKPTQATMWTEMMMHILIMIRVLAV